MESIKKNTGTLGRVIDWIVSKVAIKIAGGALAVLALLTATDVFARYFFNRPIVFSYEFAELVLVFLISFGLTHTTWNRGHLRLDLVTSLLPKTVAKFFDRLSNLASAVTLALIGWGCLIAFSRERLSGLETPILGWPVFPFIFVLAVGCIFTSLIFLCAILDVTSEGGRKK